MAAVSRALIEEFLQKKRIAFVGVSRNPRDFNRMLFREFRRRGYDLAPVNPQASEIDGLPCAARVQDVAPAADAALLMTTPAVTDQVVRDCAEAGIRLIWMYRAGGKGAVSQAAVDFCQAHGIRVVAGLCPHMFFKDTAFFHRLHGFFLKLTGGYPA